MSVRICEMLKRLIHNQQNSGFPSFVVRDPISQFSILLKFFFDVIINVHN